MTRQHTKGTSPYEELYGFSRGLRVGNRVLIAGTAPVEADGSSTPGGAVEQARRCFAIADQALRDLGSSVNEAVRTRMFITNPADADDIGRVHGAVFATARPVATMVVVAALLRPEWKVEIEVEAEISA